MKTDEIIDQIRSAFERVETPPVWSLSNSREGAEPLALEKEFAHLPQWDALTAEFLDSTPDGFGSALSFFSDEAFRYYLPAYLIGALEGQLEVADPLFHLTHGLENTSARQPINPLRYGARTWRDYAVFRFSVFDSPQASAIASYLTYELDSGERVDFEKQQIHEALDNYWRARSH